MQDTNKTTGEVQVVLTGPDGKVKQSFGINNLIVTSGKEFIAASMLKTTFNTPAAMTKMALGSGTTAPVMANTTLESEFSGGSNVRATLSATTNNNITTYSATFIAGNCTGPVTEAGIFNADVAGTMLCRTKFPVVNKEAADTLAFTWNIVQS